ncbi:MAG: hypothetical protein V1742_02830, partial [Pseudomonadota bacterium]
MDYAYVPPFITAGAPPLVMLVLGRDHKLFYEAYNDATDLDGDGNLDVGFKPGIKYYGYFDTEKCYTYNSVSKRFEPARVTSDGKCNLSGEWNGNWLNYATMSRMDALRKVLYGGYRSVDTDALTVLERSFVPQDAHTWGKEYESIVRDGYDIRDYTPLNLPDSGARHLFASTSTVNYDNASYAPLLRVLPNNTHRIWEWVSKERPVADNSLESGGGRYESYPANHTEYEALVTQFANAAHLQGSGAVSQINGSGNPYGPDDYYLSIFAGFLVVPAGKGGSYEIAVDGDDAVEVIIDGVVVAGWYNGHGSCNCTTYKGTINLTAGQHILEFRHQDRTGGDNYYLRWKGPASSNNWQIVPAANFSSLIMSTYDVNLSSGSSITDYVVRVQVCRSDMPESNCKQYPNASYKPTGILQRHGEAEEMFFGLITGSYAKNTAGGVLRKKMGAITDEINPNTGQYTATVGIIKTIDRLKIKGFDYGSFSYTESCGWIATRSINAGECRMWGNPVAEMMYEGMRYFSGAGSPTADFVYAAGDDVTLGLPLATWDDPFDEASGYSRCAKPFMLVISDINPSFDSDQLPGSYYNPGFSGTLGALNVRTLLDVVGQDEGINGTTIFIGDASGTFDTSCSPKTAVGLGQIRGLCPEEPTKQGSYYSAAVAYYARINDLNPIADGDQKVTTYTVGLSSPLPRIEIPLQG